MLYFGVSQERGIRQMILLDGAWIMIGWHLLFETHPRKTQRIVRRFQACEPRRCFGSGLAGRSLFAWPLCSAVWTNVVPAYSRRHMVYPGISWSVNLRILPNRPRMSPGFPSGHLEVGPRNPSLVVVRVHWVWSPSWDQDHLVRFLLVLESYVDIVDIAISWAHRAHIPTDGLDMLRSYRL